MRFWALFKKEWRESFPWIAVGMLAMGGLGLGFIYIAAPHVGDWWGQDFGSRGHEFYSFYRYPFTEVCVLLWMVSLGLGICLGVLHFWMPSFVRTWAFTIHRSTSRSAILGAKMLCAVLAIPVGLGLTWAVVYGYSHWIQKSMGLPYLRILIDGCIYILFGLLIYLATALAGLTTTRWYTTRFFGFFWVFIVFLSVVESQLVAALIYIGGGLVVLALLVWDRFILREFA